jgi:hypothetical protein
MPMLMTRRLLSNLSTTIYVVRIKKILEDFGVLSGLMCNLDKTMLLVIGDNVQVDERIVNLGFAIVNKLTVLGLEIDNMGYTENNFPSITKKITNQISIWCKFNQSLPGRINISKTMLYSQINYLGCFLPKKENFLNDWDKLITDFVKGKMNIARKRLYKAPEEGGLGLFNISDFLDAQKCAWIRRSLDLNKPWKALLYVNNFGCILNSKARNINPLEYPICHSICLSYERMTDVFTCVNENFYNCSIFENLKITRTLESKEQCCCSLFSNEFFLEHAHKLYCLKYSHLYGNDGNPVTREQLRDNLGLDLTVLQYFVLRNACNVAKVR